MSVEAGIEKRYAPFRSPLQGEITDEDVYAEMRLAEAPHKLVLVQPVKDGWLEGADTEVVLDRIAGINRAYDVFNKNVVAVPRHNDVVVVVGGQPLLYTVVDKVYGKNLADDDFAPEEVPQVREGFETAVLHMMWLIGHEYKKKGEILSGMGLYKFTWGTVHGQSEHRLYYTFIDPMNIEDFKEYPLRFWEWFYDDFIVPVEDLEMKFGQRLGAARRAINRLLNSVGEDDINHPTAQRLLDQLHSTVGGRYHRNLPR